jgi:uncharacterized protein (DUF433 family)
MDTTPPVAPKQQLGHAELVAHIDRVGRVIYQKSQSSQI